MMYTDAYSGSVLDCPSVDLLPVAIFELVKSRSLDEWQYAPDEEIRIPEEIISVRAFYLFLARGGGYGLDLQDWYESEAEERAYFRQTIASLIGSSCNEFTDDRETGSLDPPDEPRDTSSMDTLGVSQPPTKRSVDGRRSAAWQRRGPFREEVGKMKTINVLSSGDPRHKVLEKASRRYSDPFDGMSREELAKYQGKVVAILDETGEIIGEASTRKDLAKVVEDSGRGTEGWSCRNAPPVHT